MEVRTESAEGRRRPTIPIHTSPSSQEKVSAHAKLVAELSPHAKALNTAVEAAVRFGHEQLALRRQQWSPATPAIAT